MRALEAVQDWPVDTVAVAVVAADGHVLGEYGPQEHVFELASVTKLLTAYAALIAVEEGALGLDDPAGPPESTFGTCLRTHPAWRRTPGRWSRRWARGASTPMLGSRSSPMPSRRQPACRSRSTSALACWSRSACPARNSLDRPLLALDRALPTYGTSLLSFSNLGCWRAGPCGRLPPWRSRDSRACCRATGGRTPMTGDSVTRSVTRKHRTGPDRGALRGPMGTLAAAALSCGSTRSPAVPASASRTAISATGRSTPGRELTDAILREVS